VVKITIENLGGKVVGANDPHLPVLRHLHDNFVDWMFSCGGKGRCTSCKMIVLAGMQNISPLTPSEIKYRLAGALKSDERLACQTRITGDIQIRVSDEFKLPHVTYTD
jgi:2Fe-2S ferredoxin